MCLLCCVLSYCSYTQCCSLLIFMHSRSTSQEKLGHNHYHFHSLHFLKILSHIHLALLSLNCFLTHTYYIPLIHPQPVYVQVIHTILGQGNQTQSTNINMRETIYMKHGYRLSLFLNSTPCVQLSLSTGINYITVN